MTTQLRPRCFRCGRFVRRGHWVLYEGTRPWIAPDGREANTGFLTGNVFYADDRHVEYLFVDGRPWPRQAAEQQP